MDNGNTNLAVTDGLTPQQKKEIIAIDIDGGELPNLEDAQVLPIEINFTYWTPKETGGEEKRVFFLEIRPEKVQSISSQEIVDLDTAIFIERTEDGIRQIGNGSKRLVGPLMNAIDNGIIKRGTPLLIKHIGKKKNKNNNFFSDDWSIKPLILSI